VVGVCAFFVSSRYRVPALPIWSLFAVVGVAWIAETVHRRRRRDWLAPAGGLAALLVALNLPTREARLDLRQEELFYRGEASLDAGQLERARDFLGAALDMAPADGEAWNLLGEVRSGLGDAGGALEAWQRSVACDPTFADPWRSIAGALAKKGDLDGAIRTLQQSLAHAGDPHNHGNDYGVDLVMLAEYGSQKGDLDSALRAADQALELDPSNVKAQRLKARILSRRASPPGGPSPGRR
jgi:tetratricopeptide (TPR) repeat protein